MFLLLRLLLLRRRFLPTNSEEAKSTTWLHPVTGEAVITGHRKTPGKEEEGEERVRENTGEFGKRFGKLPRNGGGGKQASVGEVEGLGGGKNGGGEGSGGFGKLRSESS